MLHYALNIEYLLQRRQTTVHISKQSIEKLSKTRSVVPRKPLRIFGDIASSVRCENFRRFGVEYDQRRNASDTVLLAQFRLQGSIFKRQSQPWHFTEVFFPRGEISVRADEDDLELISIFLLEVVIELGQDRREAATRRAPMSGEVQTDDFLFLADGLDGHLVSFTVHDVSSDQSFQSRHGRSRD